MEAGVPLGYHLFSRSRTSFSVCRVRSTTSPAWSAGLLQDRFDQAEFHEIHKPVERRSRQDSLEATVQR